jgi:hypothetical protein
MISWHMAVITEVSAVSATPSRKMRLQHNYTMMDLFHFLPVNYSLDFLSFQIKCSEILAVTKN